MKKGKTLFNGFGVKLQKGEIANPGSPGLGGSLKKRPFVELKWLRSVEGGK